MLGNEDVVLHHHDAHANLVGDAVYQCSADAYLFPGLVKEGLTSLPAVYKVGHSDGPIAFLRRNLKFLVIELHVLLGD